MKHLSLATRYRPQRFDEIAGQDLIKAVLSRASAEDRVASGYLLSGTRGVGKTTIARIFAKALNCEHAPCAEPCNQCQSCLRVTAGTHPDVIEMDGASNNSVEDARALRETVGFTPMEGRYKIFIVDEAHMLSRSAFNALLKTLEEPPAHVVFIFATTEVFRFPATILSRCQVFSFRHLSEDTISAHLGKILTKEGMPYEDTALRLLARRAAGSARDSMSLLDQVLAYGPETLNAETVRKVLGLADMDAMGTLFDALATGSCADAALFTRELVAKEIDIGFFLRELTDTVRSLFLLRQCDRQSVARLGVPEAELDFLSGIAPKFTPSYLHAAWQMILESQRSVSTSQEPSSALELLLVNLALLPRLLPSDLAGGAARETQPSRPEHPRPEQRAGQMAAPARAPGPHAVSSPEPAVTPQPHRPEPARQQTAREYSPEAAAVPSKTPHPQSAGDGQAQARTTPARRPMSEPAPQPSPSTAPQSRTPQERPAPSARGTHPDAGDMPPWEDIPVENYEEEGPVQAPDQQAAPQSSPPASVPEAQSDAASVPAGRSTFNMDQFRAWLDGQPERMGVPTYLVNDLSLLAQESDSITLECGSASLASAVQRDITHVEAAVAAHMGRPLRVEITLSRAAREQSMAARGPASHDRPELKYCFEILKAHVERVHRSG